MKKFSTKKESTESKASIIRGTAANEYTIDRLESDRVVISGHGRAFNQTNPIGELDADGEIIHQRSQTYQAKTILTLQA